MFFVDGSETVCMVGLVTEYNPFHNGHLYHLLKSKEITGSCAVAVMSGNFVQRGEPAIVDKFLRTQMALENGVDIVLELPVFFATANAEFFARGAIKTLMGSNTVDSVCFGSECGDLSVIEKLADFFCNKGQAYEAELKEELSEGVSFPRARQQALEKFLRPEEIDCLSQPNNILAVEYLKALRQSGSWIVPFTVPRLKSSHNALSLEGSFSSSTAVRAVMRNKGSLPTESLPPTTINILSAQGFRNDQGISEDNLVSSGNMASLNELSEIFHYIVDRSSPKYLASLSEVSEGLENRIIRAAKEAFLLSDILALLKTKRYTYARLQRIALHIILGITKKDYFFYGCKGPLYIRVLGFRKESENELRRLCKNSTLPVITNVKHANRLSHGAQYMLEKDLQASDMYYLATGLKKRSKSDQLVIV